MLRRWCLRSETYAYQYEKVSISHRCPRATTTNSACTSACGHIRLKRRAARQDPLSYVLNFLAPRAVRRQRGISVKTRFKNYFFELVRILAQKISSVEKLRGVFFRVRRSVFRKIYLSSSVKNANATRVVQAPCSRLRCGTISDADGEVIQRGYCSREWEANMPINVSSRA